MQSFRLLGIAGAASLLFLEFFAAAASSQERVSITPAPSATQPSADEHILFDAANRERQSQGLKPLRWDPLLATAAREHASVMLRQNDISHQCAGEPSLQERAAQAGARFSFIAENIALGQNADETHHAWMRSPGHRKNILSPELTSVGIGTVRGSRGLFSVQDFSRPVPTLSFEQQEGEVMSLLAGEGLQDANASVEARKICKANGGFSGKEAQAIFHFEQPDLSALPEELVRAIHSRAYRKAAVGACTRRSSTGFVQYRIAVVLY